MLLKLKVCSDEVSSSGGIPTHGMRKMNCCVKHFLHMEILQMTECMRCLLLHMDDIITFKTLLRFTWLVFPTVRCLVTPDLRLLLGLHLASMALGKVGTVVGNVRCGCKTVSDM